MGIVILLGNADHPILFEDQCSQFAPAPFPMMEEGFRVRVAGTRNMPF
jgi:hypothetical protein